MPKPKAPLRRQVIAGAIRIASLLAALSLSRAYPPPSFGLLLAPIVILAGFTTSYLWHFRMLRTMRGMIAVVSVAAFCMVLCLKGIPATRLSAWARAKCAFHLAQADACRSNVKFYARSAGN